MKVSAFWSRVEIKVKAKVCRPLGIGKLRPLKARASYDAAQQWQAKPHPFQTRVDVEAMADKS